MPRTIARIALVFLLFTGFLAAPSAQAEESSSPKTYTLAYKYHRGEVLRYEVHHSANMQTTIEGTSQDAETQSESVKAWKVTDVLPSGDIEFVHVVESVRMTNRVPNRAVTVFDSQENKTPPPGFEQAARAVGVPLSVIRSTLAGKIVSRQEKHPQPATSVDMPVTLRLPDKPVAVGDDWSESFDLTVDQESGAKQQIKTRRLCRLESVDTGIATIAVEYQILTPVSPFVEANLVERITKGTVRFDIERGRIVSQQHDADHRILGFHGDSSMLHHTSRQEERLLKAGEHLATKASRER